MVSRLPPIARDTWDGVADDRLHQWHPLRPAHGQPPALHCSKRMPSESLPEIHALAGSHSRVSGQALPHGNMHMTGNGFTSNNGYLSGIGVPGKGRKGIFMSSALSRVVHVAAIETIKLPGVRLIKRASLVQSWLNQRRLAFFLSAEGLNSYYGVFNSFGEARHCLPKSEEFNQRVLTAEYTRVRMHRVYSYDYPIMYWLSVAFGCGAKSVFDSGGSVGVHYHGYKKLLAYPPELNWQVYEQPAIAQLGTEIASATDAPGLVFTDALNLHNMRADVWISAGAIHYIENGRPSSLLQACARRPQHVLLNKLPLYEGDDFVSAQNLGENSFAPQHVYNRERFIADICNIGYRLVDSWDVPERNFYLPGHPEKSFSRFTGLYFRAVGSDPNEPWASNHTARTAPRFPARPPFELALSQPGNRESPHELRLRRVRG